MDLHLLRQLARANGLVVRDDLVPAAMSRTVWQHAHTMGALARVHRGVSRLIDAPQTFEQRASAAVIACGDQALAAGPTAARLWGANVAADIIHVIVAPNRDPRPHGVVVHRPGAGRPLHRDVRSGVPLTDPVRAVVDVAAWEPAIARSVFEELVVAGRLHPRSLLRHLAENPTQGRPGIEAIRAVVVGWEGDHRPADSVLELRMMALLKRHRLPQPTFQVPIGRYRVDFLWPQEMVVLECDGWETHGRHRTGFERDRVRDAALHAEGYVVWRYTWTQITRRSAWLADEIRRGLRVRRAQLGLPPTNPNEV